MNRILASAGALTLLASGVVAGPALADPKPALEYVIDLDCGLGVVEVVAMGNGAWTPAHDINSTDMYQPLGFEGVTATVEILDGDDAGSVYQFPADEDGMKNGKRTGVHIHECSFSSVFEGYDEDFGATIRGTYGGTVFLKTTAR